MGLDKIAYLTGAGAVLLWSLTMALVSRGTADLAFATNALYGTLALLMVAALLVGYSMGGRPQRERHLPGVPHGVLVALRVALVVVWALMAWFDISFLAGGGMAAALYVGFFLGSSARNGQVTATT